MKPEVLKPALEHLQSCDKMRLLIKAHGKPTIGREANAWKVLSNSIIGQQISVHAARAIRQRFAATAPEGDYPLPAHVLGTPDEVLRGAGLSANKVLSLRDLAAHFEEGKIKPRRFSKMEDEEIIQTLIPVRGIGRWTAEMFLLFGLNRMDIWAIDDQGLRNAIRNLYELPEVPKPKEMHEYAVQWQPYRSVASWYLWRSLDNVPKVK